MVDERIKQLRKTLGLTQTEFGARVGLSRDAMANIETGRVEPKALAINMICAEYNVREEWLRNGTGDMFRVMDAGDHLAELAGRILGENGDDLIDRLCAVLADLTPDEKDFIYRIACRLVSESTEKGEE